MYKEESGRLDTTREISLRLLPFGPDRVGEFAARTNLPPMDIERPAAQDKFFVEMTGAINYWNTFSAVLAQG